MPQNYFVKLVFAPKDSLLRHYIENFKIKILISKTVIIQNYNICV